MKAPLFYFVFLCASIAGAQAPGHFQVVIDPPGDNVYHTLVGGLVAPDSSTYVLGGYQNIAEPAFTLGKYTANGQSLWSRKVEYAGTGAQLTPAKVVRMSTGDLFVFGILSTTGGHDYFVTRMSAEGDVQWTRTYRQDIIGNDYGFSSIVATSDDQLVVSMGFINRTVAMRLSIDGDLLWARRYVTDLSPTNKNPGFDFAATADGGVLLTEKAQEDIFLVRLASDGTVDWAKRYPNGGYCQTHTAILLEDGGFVIAGLRETHPYAARLDAAGQLIWIKEYAFDEGYVELFGHAVELSDGDLLLTPSWNSTGILALRVTPLGAPVNVRTMDGDGYATVIGRQNGFMVLGGRTFIEVNGGFENAMLLMGTNESLDLGCLQGSTGATATDIPQEPPVLGYDVITEPIVEGTVEMNVTTPLFGVRSFCPSTVAVAELAQHEMMEVYPSPVTGGSLITLGPLAEGPVAYVERIAGDGTNLRIPPTRAGDKSMITTSGWATGLYLLRAIDGDGRPLGVARVVVE